MLISRLTQILGLESDVVADVGNRAISWYHYFLLCNPIVTFYAILNRQAGSHNAILDFINYRNEYQANLVTEHWILISLMVQMLLAVLFLWMAVQGIRNKK